MYAREEGAGDNFEGQAAGVVNGGLTHGRTERLTAATVVKIACAAKGAMPNRIETGSACETFHRSACYSDPHRVPMPDWGVVAEFIIWSTGGLRHQ